jgi:hypothetical protein
MRCFLERFLVVFIFLIHFQSQNISEAGMILLRGEDHYLILVFWIGFVANWAQASGKLKQNIAIPYIPAPNQPHWTPRYGSTTVVLGNETVFIS